MPDLESQLRSYAEWMAAEADAVEHDDAPQVVPLRPANHRPWPAVAAALAAIAMVGVILAVRGSGPSTDPPAAPVDGTVDVTVDPTPAPATTTEPVSLGRPYDPRATMRPDLLVILPPLATPGSVVAAMFPEQTLRGVAFSLERRDGAGWNVTHLLASGDPWDTEPSWWDPNEEDLAWPDIGLEGTGPDRLMLPPGLESGEYRICTANVPANYCAPFGVEEFAPFADTVATEDANLTLHVSNQSFVDDPVIISVYLDGERIITDRFEVLGQHNWFTFELAVAPGDHEILVTSDTGAVLVESISIPETDHRWAVADYWHYPPDPQHEDGVSRSFTFNVSDSPIGFD